MQRPRTMSFFLFVLVTTALLPGLGLGAQQNSFQYNTIITGLTGHVAEFKFYGPPGYGEDPKKDKMETHYILHLEKQIAVTPPAGDAVNKACPKVRMVELVGAKENLAKYADKKVAVSGKLVSSPAGKHMTDVILELKSIALAGGQ